ncbi:MAG: AMP-binding protein [Luteitalea sp.]|nr:AMP-binding protein [Luteitalea sp.]
MERHHAEDAHRQPRDVFMSDLLLRCYHRLPGPFRSVAATARGEYLRRWRYGPETGRLIEQAHEREYWDGARWERWRAERLAHVLHRAATKVPYYREQWAARRAAGDRSSPERLEHWPILEKDAVRRHARSLVADGCDIKRMFHEHTSGTTGKPLDLWWPRAAVREWYALFEARCRLWYGVSRHDRWAMLAGQLVTPVEQLKPPFWVWNSALHQLYMSSYHLSPAFLPSYLDALSRYRITHLSGYASALYSLAQEALRQGRRDIQMRVAITNAEPVFDHQRRAITEAFGCPVCETYGMAEIVTCGSQCAAGRLHSWPEIGVTEVDAAGGLDETGAGALLGTSLLNADMPLVRYRTGDRGAMAPEDAPCACGRSLPVIASIDGRADDMLYTSDGRSVGRLDPVFKAQVPVREAQIIQETLTRVRVRFVPGLGFTATTERSIASRLRARLGDIDVVFEAVTDIPRTSRGKFRAVVCELPESERQRLSIH